jgi:Yip1 domain
MATNPSVPPQPLQPMQPALSEGAAPLSEGRRLIDVFFAPSKIFTDLRRNASWWAPFLITAIVSMLFVYVVDQKVGFRKVAENQIKAQPKQAERMEQMPADQREKVMQQQVSLTRIISYAFVLVLLLWFVIVAAVLLATIKFGVGAEVKFKTLFALTIYATLPGLLKSLLAIAAILAGVSSDGFTFQNPVATNPGYFIDPTAAPVLYSLLTKLDIFSIWTMVLTAIGITCISKVKTGTAFAVVFGWFIFLTLAGVGFTAAFS